MNNKIWKLCILVLIPLIIWFIPPPDGLTESSWRLFGFYLAAIFGLILKPFSEAVVLMAAVGFAGIFLNNTSKILVGYSTSTVWLVFAAFGISVAFVKTGLGRRIAYHMIRAFGSTTLRLGYVTAFLEFVISPVTPSNTARSGGIVFPIVLSVVKALGSEPGESAQKAGSYLMSNIYFVMKVSSFIFITAMAPNLLTADFAAKILDVHLDWGIWALAMIVPGIALLLIVPAIGYYLDKPEITHVDNKKIAQEGLAELGPMTKNEKILVGIFISALLGWALPSILGQGFGIGLKIDATAVAIVATVLCILLGVIKWDDVLNNKGAWNTLLWFGGIIGLASALNKAKVFDWLASLIQNNIDFGHNPFIVLTVIGFLSIAVRYFFASASSYAIAMLPVFLTVGKVAGADPMALALVLAATNSYGGSLTHYGGGAAPIIFGAGYSEVKKWWISGAVIAIACFIVTMTVGYVWWQFLGIVN
ncbi:anion permease [Leminorella grimontii]|uniref:anion permease n=1 Tax=Leminorella grimontii TaxID=82981 RepID=UPI00208A90E9|nr:anion permease [Leminorella grimontii]GKX59666.1 membrane protein [Leminorella grimontii]